MEQPTEPPVANSLRETQTREHQRERDQFFTSEEVAAECYALLWSYLTPFEYLFIEPSAGEGAFAQLFPVGGRAYDIEVRYPGVIETDFLGVNLPYSDNVVVVGNPPFGKNAKLAVQFFNHAARRAFIIAFILPRSFQKISVQNRLHRHFHLRREWLIPDDAFIFDGKRRSVPTVFQIWEWSPEMRPIVILPTSHPDFIFTTRTDADFAVRRVGVKAGIIHDELGQSANSNFFVKAVAPFVRQIMEEIDFGEVVVRTAGSPCLAKTELVELYTRQRKKLVAFLNPASSR